MSRIFVLGSINLDYVVSTNSIPKKGETILGGNVQKAFGGKGANQAVACASFSKNVYMIGAVGNDSEGISMIDNLEQRNVDTRYVKKTSSSSGVAFITLAEQDNTIVVSPGANNDVSIQDVKTCIDSEATKGDYFVAQLESPFEVVFASLEYAKKQGLCTVVNLSPYQERACLLIPLVDYLFVNETEYQQLRNVLKPELILEKGCNIVLTKGSTGSEFISSKRTTEMNTFKVDVVDTTAAGDTFLGMFIAKLGQGSSISDILLNSNAAGALATTKLGAQPSIPTMEDVMGFIKNNIQFDLKKYIQGLTTEKDKDIDLVYDNNATYPYVRKPKIINELVDDFNKSFLIDYDYTEKIKKIENVDSPSEEHTINELKTMVTSLIRKDRFIEGHLMTNVKNGALLHMLMLIQNKIKN